MIIHMFKYAVCLTNVYKEMLIRKRIAGRATETTLELLRICEALFLLGK